MRSYLTGRMRSFLYAWRGIKALPGSGSNFVIHLVAAILVIGAGFFFNLSSGEWWAVILCITIVLAAEAFNTAIELLVDMVQPDHDPRAGRIKDIAAGAVLITAMGAAAIGIMIFGTHIVAWIMALSA